MLAKEYNLPIILLCNSSIDLTITDENYIICNINTLNQEYYFFKVPSKYSRKKEHNYNVDFYIKVLQDNGSEQEWIIEIKPESQFKKPILEGKNSTLIKLKSYNHKMQVWITNQAKFKAAKLWAEGRGFKFGVVDENFLFRSK
jgi:hypothetical protein